MSRQRFPFPSLLALALGLSVTTGCVEERAFYILQNQLPQLSDGVCTASAGEGTFLAEGVLDISAGQGYWMFPLLKFDILSSNDQVEKNNFTLREFRINLDMSEIPGEFPAEETSFTRPTSGPLRPQGTLGTVVKVVPDALVARLNVPIGVKPMIVAKIRAVAVRLATDSEIESTTFRYPITLCNGCLMHGGKINPCPTGEEETAPTIVTNDCGVPQDSTVFCCSVDGVVGCLSKTEAK